MNTRKPIIFAAFAAMLSAFFPAAAFDPANDKDWQLIWSEEFDSNEMDTTKWSYMRPGGSTWSRFIAKGEGAQEYVNRFEHGLYKSYCFKTPAEYAAENKEMISGAIYTSGKFHMRGGYIEARCKTIPHPGNFQAFWLMPSDHTGGWPVCGEIDVWEQIDDEPIAYQTLHHAMRYPKHPNSAKYHEAVPVDSTFTGIETPAVNGAEWHVYGVEWDAEHLTFYIDGKETGTIVNPHYAEGPWTEAVTWPFDKYFYVILNQSVGNGSWAKDADIDFRYQTDFDYVRAYQKKDKIDFEAK